MDQRQQLEQAISAQEALRGTLSDEVIEATIGALRDKLAALESADPQQQRKLATILFADVAGFTAMSETLDPEIVTGIMNDLWARLDAAIVDQGGHIDKHIGDAVMALWGTDAAREDDAEQAIRAALAMQEALTSFYPAKDGAGEVMQLSMRIGINTGPVLLGQVGSTREFTAMGDAVNLASRLEHAAPAGGILISYDTYCHVRGLFDVQALEPIQVKGKVEPVQVYVVRAARPRSFRKTTRGVEGVQTRMIGREKELLALQHAFQDVFEGFETRVETVIGEAGVGKSRLLYEFDNWLNCQPQQFALLKGRANVAEENLTRALFRDIFSNHFDIRDVDSKAVVQEKFHMGTTGILELDQADVLGHWLGFDFSGSKAVRSLLGSPVLGTQARSHLMDYMEALAVTAPLLILLEDLHWADDASLDLVEDLARTIGDAHPGQARLLIIGLARPGLFRRRPNWGKELAIFGRILLAPLSRRASGALVNEILQRVDNVPDSLRDFVVDAAEGNPFYVEELIKMFIEHGVIETEPSWRVLPERLAETEVPATLTSLLQARLDSLRRPERQTIQQAAVIGRLFWDTAVCSLAATEVQDIWPLLDEIRRREMIFQHDQSSFAGADEYTFKHALLRDVAYETVLLKARRTYHCRAAEWLEAHAGERRKEYLNQIAAHYLLADEGEKALPYLLQAGDQARLLYATEEAVDHYERALAILKERGENEEVARLLMKLGLTHSNAFDFEAAQKAYDESFALRGKVKQDSKHYIVIEPHEEERARGEEPISVPEPQPQNVLTLPIFEGDLGPGFDPLGAGAEDYDLFPGLVQLSRDLDVVPDAARYWEILDNGRRYLFHLRDDVFWSDGRQVTAADFIYAWYRMLDPQGNVEVASLFYDIAGAADYHQGRGSKEDVGIKALDERTLEIKLKHPTAYFMQLLCHHIASAVPRHVVERHGPRWADVDHLVTCGPFRLQSLDEKSLVLRRDPTYHGRFEGNVEGIEYRFYPNFELQLADYNACRLDTLGWVPTSMRESPHFSPELWENFNSYPGLRVAAIIFDVNQWPFDDPRVRRAFVLATDRRRVAGEEEYGRGTAVTGGFVPPSIPGHVPDIALPFDPAAAGRLLAEAGFPGGVGMPVVRVIMQPYNQQEEVERVLEPWQDFLGVEIEWQAFPYEDILTQITRQQPHINFSAWEADYPDPDSFLRVAVREWTVWHDEAYDALVEEARTSLDHNRRRELFRQAEEILAREAPLMPLLYLNDHRFVRPWIKNYQHHVNFKPHWHKVTIERH